MTGTILERPATATTRLALSQITRGGRTWPRAGLDHAQVELFRELLLEDPDALPPVIVIDDRNGGFILADGHHRAQAHEDLGAGHERIAAEVRQAPQGRAPEDYAYELALEHSARTSVPLTQAEKRAAVRRLLAEQPGLSYRKIGSMVGVDHKTVAKVARDDGGESPQSGSARSKTHASQAEGARGASATIRAGERLFDAEDDAARAGQVLAEQLLARRGDDAGAWAAWHCEAWDHARRRLRA